MQLTQTMVRELFDYNATTGFFIWKKALSDKIAIGQKAGTLKDGYIRITINGKKFAAHRLAFLYMTGEWPKGHVDHKNRNRQDNRWENLRVASRRQNMLNASKRLACTSAYKGVSYSSKYSVWVAQTTVDRLPVFIGNFDSELEAAKAYDLFYSTNKESQFVNFNVGCSK